MASSIRIEFTIIDISHKVNTAEGIEDRLDESHLPQFGDIGAA